METWKKVLIGLGVLSLLAIVGVLVGYRQVVTPPPAAPELAERPKPVITRSASSAPSGAFVFSGIVVDEVGQPVETTLIFSSSASGEHTLESGPDGRFSHSADGAGILSLAERAGAPDDFDLEGPRDDLRFVVSPLCPVTVVVLDPQGAPLADAEVELEVETAASRSETTLWTDGAGEALFEQAACGVAELHVDTPEHPALSRRGLDTLVETRFVVQLRAGAWLSGVVMDSEGSPIPGAKVWAGASWDRSEDDGQYGMWVDPSTLTQVKARAEGYRDHSEKLRLAEDAQEASLDLYLEEARLVEVYCAGLPEDSCESVLPIMCTHPLLPLGTMCLPDDPVTCDCPTGQAAVRGGGQAVAVNPEDDVAWLDFRMGGGITGVVTQDGEPAACTATVTYIPQSAADLSKGLAHTRLSQCDALGRFTALGLEPGVWMVDLRAGENLSAQSRQLPFIEVADALVDVGEIDFAGGGRIEGVVLDALTGQGAPQVPVVAVETHPDNPQLPRTATGFSVSEGQFVLLGLDDGEYEVMVSTAPFRKVPVTVKDGVNTSEVILESRTADILDEAGFHLVTDEQGELVVDRVDADGDAQVGGLLEGDRVEGVILFGVDVEERFPDLDLSETILGSYDGPGVSLKVDREGEEVIVEL